jgi:hypothetical protein
MFTERAYNAIGRSVISAQLFETALVPMFEFFKMVLDPDYREQTHGYVAVGKFKVPVRNIVKELATRGDIAPDLEERLSKYVDDRHLLIHRWTVEKGVPSSGDSEASEEIIVLADRVSREAETLRRNIITYMLSSQDLKDMSEYRRRVGRMFQDGHRGEE